MSLETPPSGNVVNLRRRQTYTAHLEQFEASGLAFSIAGTLDGFIDFAISDGRGHSVTYGLTLDDGRRIIAGLHKVIDDIGAHCLYDKDALLR